MACWVVADLATGITAFKLLSYVFAYALYPFASYELGIIKGGLLMTAVASSILSIKEDAFITMVYLRHGSHQYNGMSARDWRIF